ncbi:unnamed protein product [Microthlaspi erraticum]|uniref:Uncharacterized protein n=1 Tax=Microthlaspi erraticum TaxID=1685480 RepID=A0A6D2JPL5_9BRAS|nr:unnamed protein product [Microthlaspi erraticum]
MMRIWFPWSGENESRLQNLQKRKRQRGRRVLQDISPDDDDVFGGFSDDNLDLVDRDAMISVDRGPLPPGSDGAVVRPDRSWRRPSEANTLPVRPSAFGRLWTSLQYKRDIS